MDLLDFDTKNAGARPLRLLHPATGEPLGTEKEPSQVWLYGADSPEFERAQSVARLKVLQRKKKAGDLAEMDDQEIVEMANEMVSLDEEKTSEILAAVTSKFENIEINGNPVTDFKKAYVGFKWLREQCDAHLSNRANFMPSASKA